MSTLKKLIENAQECVNVNLNTNVKDVLKIKIYTSSWTSLEDKIVMVSYRPVGWTEWVPFKYYSFKVFKRTFKQVFHYDWEEKWKDLMIKGFYKTY